MVSPAPDVPARRESDWGWRAVWKRQLHRIAARNEWMVTGGQGLLLVTGAITTLTAPLLHPTARIWAALLAVAVAMSAVLVSSQFLPWRRLPGWFPLLFPAAVAAALAVLGVYAGGIAGSWTGLIVLSFVYIGLTQPRWTTLKVMPIAAIAWVAANDTVAAAQIPRLIIGVLLWAVLGELLASLITRQRSMAVQLNAAAYLDSLTGVANRRGLTLRLDTVAVDDTVILCDLDHFKNLNDTHGHAAGDAALADFGTTLRTCLRESDYSARYGGEEFVVILPYAPSLDVDAVLARLRHHWQLTQPGLTFSAGVATCTATQNATAALVAADAALYDAKHGGRDQHRYAPPPNPAGIGLRRTAGRRRRRCPLTRDVSRCVHRKPCVSCAHVTTLFVCARRLPAGLLCGRFCGVTKHCIGCNCV